MPVGVAGCPGEGEDDFIAGLVVPVEGSVPAVGHLVGAVCAVENVLCILGTVSEAVFTDIDLGVEVQAYQQGCGAGLCPLTLDGLVAAHGGFLRQFRDRGLEFRLDKFKNLAGLHLSLGVLAGIVVTHGQGNIAESIEQSQIEPCAQHAVLRLQVVELGLGEAELGGRELVEVLDDEVGLHDALEAAVVFALGFAIGGKPLVTVQTGPAPTVVPPVFTGGGDELVGGLLVEHLAALDAPEPMLKGAEDSADDILLGIVIVL